MATKTIGTVTNTKEKQYLMVLAKDKSLWDFKDKFKELKGHFIHIGYIFPIEKEEEVGEIVKELDIEPIKFPLGEGQTFETVKLSFTAEYFREELVKTEEKLTEILQGEDPTEELINALEDSDQKEKALKLLEIKTN